MDPEKFVNMQVQMRRNNEEFMAFNNDLTSWADEMKAKDAKLKDASAKLRNDSTIFGDPAKASPHQLILKAPGAQNLPPVRNSLLKKRKKAKKAASAKPDAAKRKISGYDFRAWDKFDVEKACQEVSEEDDDGAEEDAASSSTDEEWERERARLTALEEKEKGNQYYKDGDFERANECYIRASVLDPTCAVYPGNQAMALLKLARFDAAETAATAAIDLDPGFVKAWLRRGTARMALEKMDLAEFDFTQALKLDPKNGQAKTELTTLQTVKQSRELMEHVGPAGDACSMAGLIRPIHKPVRERSRKPLVRVQIQDVDFPEKPAPQPVSTATVDPSLPPWENPALPAAPASPMQFQTDFKYLRVVESDPNFSLLSRYLLHRVPANPDWCALFGQSCDISSIKAIVTGFSELLRPGQPPSKFWDEERRMIVETVPSLFARLTKVPRFSTIAMFMTDADKASLRRLLETIRNCDDHHHDNNEIKSLMSSIESAFKLR